MDSIKSNWVTSLTHRVTWCQQSRDQWKHRWSFPIGGLLTPSHYLAWLRRYWDSNISGSRFWPFWVTWCHRAAWTIRTFNKLLSKTIFKISNLLLCFSTLTILSTHFSATNIPYTIESLCTFHPEQLISFAFSSRELAIATFPLCLLNACHVNFSIRQCLYYFTCSTCQWVNIPGTDPKSPAFLQSISP